MPDGGVIIRLNWFLTIWSIKWTSLFASWILFHSSSLYPQLKRTILFLVSVKNKIPSCLNWCARAHKNVFCLRNLTPCVFLQNLCKAQQFHLLMGCAGPAGALALFRGVRAGCMGSMPATGWAWPALGRCRGAMEVSMVGTGSVSLKQQKNK